MNVLYKDLHYLIISMHFKYLKSNSSLILEINLKFIRTEILNSFKYYQKLGI